MPLKKSKKKSPSKSNETAAVSNGRTRKSRFWFFKNKSLRLYFIITSLIFFIIAAAYVAYLDIEIRSQFEGKKWALPARVFARPLEMYPGLIISKANLIKELEFLNYSAQRITPGSYRVQGDIVSIYTRGFSFWDSSEPSRTLHIVFQQNGIKEILDGECTTKKNDNCALGLIRLEPAQIASIYPAHNEDRELLRLVDAPPILLATLLAIEDKDFDRHWGIKPASILRALLVNIRAGETLQGGSTLTQQLVKNFFLSNERSLRRKAVEAVMALLLESHYSKDEILETYLNEVFLGQDGDRAIHGFALASRYYFNRPLNELRAEQIALLVGMVKGPSYYDPQRHPQRAKARRDVVINIMHAENYISAAEASRLRLSALSVVEKNKHRGTVSYPAFMDMVRRTLRRDYRDEDLRTEGLRIFTTMDPVVQAVAEQALSQQLSSLERYYGIPANTLEGAVTVTSTDGGEVLAMVGGRDPRYAGFNRVLDARRPIGSLVKPAVYYLALSHHSVYHPITRIDDSPLGVRLANKKEWRPANYDKIFHGEVPLYEALVNSYNVATARLGLTLGLDKVIDILNKMGLDELEASRAIPAYPSVLLGAVDLSVLEVTQMYQTLAANGFRVPLNSVREVLTSDNKPLHRYPLKIRQTLDNPAAIFTLNTLLQQVVSMGTARRISTELPALNAAGKTGTSDDLRDSWFAGFSGEHLAVVWVGRDDNQPVNLSGSTGALPIWLEMMKQLVSRPLILTPPANIVMKEVDLDSQLLSNGKCEKVLPMPFIIGAEPQTMADCQKKSFWQQIFTK